VGVSGERRPFARFAIIISILLGQICPSCSDLFSGAIVLRGQHPRTLGSVDVVALAAFAAPRRRLQPVADEDGVGGAAGEGEAACNRDRTRRDEDQHYLISSGEVPPMPPSPWRVPRSIVANEVDEER
jgi:hypothetical protein